MKTAIEMAKEAGFTEGELSFMTTMFEAFAELVRADEREACAKVCDDINAVEYKDDHWYHASEKCAAAIRARSNT